MTIKITPEEAAKITRKEAEQHHVDREGREHEDGCAYEEVRIGKPAKYTSQAYREGWETIFGRTNERGQA